MMTKLHGLDWERIRDSLEMMGAPITAVGFEFPKEKIIEALVLAEGIRPDRFTILSKMELDRPSADLLRGRLA